MPAGKKNKYTITIRNTGDYSARNVHIEDIVSGNAKYLKDTISYDKNYNLKVEWDGKSSKVIIPVLKSKEEYILTYYMEYIDSEQDYDVTNTVKIKGDNIKEKEVKEKVLVKGVIKETTLDIIKEVEKKTVKDGDINTYTTSITNTGDYAARNVHIEENIEGNANIVKTSVKVLNSKGEDITKTLKKEDLVVKDNNIIVNVPNISSKEKYKIIYDVKYDNSEKDNIVTNDVEVKGSNVKKNTSTAKVEVLGVKENIVEKEILPKILPKAGKRQRRQITIYTIIALVLIVPILIIRREYIQAKKRQMRKNRRR